MNVIQIGLGPMGRAVSHLLLQKPDWHIVAAVDIDPAQQGRDLAEIVGVKKHTGITVRGDIPDLRGEGVDLAFLTTVSTLPSVLPTLHTLVKSGLNVVTSAEEVFYPHYRYPEQAHELDELAKQYGVSILGSGITPGFIMDTLVLLLTGVCQKVTRIAVTRVVNAAGSRPLLQQKMGVGLTLEAFAEQEAQHQVGMVGMVDALAFLAKVMQWPMDDFKERLVPVVAEKPIISDSCQIAIGQVRGLRYMVKGLSQGKEVISFDLRAYFEAENVRDTIYIEGTPALEMSLKSTDMGDVAAAGLLVNTGPAVCQARPGLLTVLDLPSPYFRRQL